MLQFYASAVYILSVINFATKLFNRINKDSIQMFKPLSSALTAHSTVHCLKLVSLKNKGNPL
jgi:hypothetical protein